ncbi:hypothetical protein [Nocardioides sp. CFH 31398]|uniref:hypothetical protein n=1 Tax=Nocardioides sp. CFH 31398 TaxID=2919579 RepID=UPI001F06C00D|nr:hypothetical protein [Nocardioides sp. CFH 31398]MCH1867081.1 hypothetical protein [Nocardioides sp. CFH 31398]
MTTKAKEPTQYRVVGGQWQTVQLQIPEGVGIVNATYRGGDVLPGWITTENVEHLLSVRAIEEAEVGS